MAIVNGEMHPISTTNGQNIPNAYENLGLKYFLPCIAHSLHLVVGAALMQKKEDVLEEDWMFEGNKTDVFNGNNVAGVKAKNDEVDSLWTEIDTFVSSVNVSREELETVRCVVHRFRTLAMFFLRSQKGATRLKQLQRLH